MVDVVSWQIVGSWRVGRRGLGVKTGKLPTPLKMMSTIELFTNRSSATLVGSLQSPSIMFRWEEMSLSETERALRSWMSLDGVLTTRGSTMLMDILRYLLSVKIQTYESSMGIQPLEYELGQPI